ncbi:MAG: hypothetical protein JKY37_28335 [Nannocystaceae bacterium]|nr:hypothetical protein [Nannocystaceae bacterium]
MSAPTLTTTPAMTTWISASIALCVMTGCGAAVTPRGARAVSVGGAFPAGPTPPTHGLALPSLDVPWVPARLVAGDLDALVAVIAERDTAVLSAPASWLAPSMDPVSVAEGIARLAPKTRWLPPRRGTLAEAWSDVPATRSLGETVEIAIDRAWVVRQGAGADVLVAIDEAPGSLETWRAKPASMVGGCDALAEVLAVGQEHGLAEVEPFVAHVDALLLQLYRAAVAVAVPQWLHELEPYQGADDGSAGHACGRAYLAYVRDVAACARAERSDCTAAPRVYLHGGLTIGLPIDPTIAATIDSGRLTPGELPHQACTAWRGTDYLAASRRLAFEAAQALDGVLDPRWLQLADRVGALTEVHHEIVAMCAPQRRRHAPEDLVVARQRLTRVGQALSSGLDATMQGHFVPATVPTTVPTTVPNKTRTVTLGAQRVVPVAEFDGGATAVAERSVADTRALAAWLSTRARCLGGGTPPWTVLTADPETGQPLSLTYVYPESLVCDP